VNGGETTSVEFVADKTGTFEYYCSVGAHRAMGMTGSLVVE
jgi:nitrite reductase (NO-forming)